VPHYSPLFPGYEGLGCRYSPTVKRVGGEAYRVVHPRYTPQGGIYTGITLGTPLREAYNGGYTLGTPLREAYREGYT